MKVWVLTLGDSGALYSIGYNGGRPCFESKELAQQSVNKISEHDAKYLEPRGGLVLQSVEAEETMLNNLGLIVADSAYR